MTQKYHLLVLDLDGTLTNSKKEISPRNLHRAASAWYWPQAAPRMASLPWPTLYA